MRVGRRGRPRVGSSRLVLVVVQRSRCDLGLFGGRRSARQAGRAESMRGRCRRGALRSSRFAARHRSGRKQAPPARTRAQPRPRVPRRLGGLRFGGLRGASLRGWLRALVEQRELRGGSTTSAQQLAAMHRSVGWRTSCGASVRQSRLNGVSSQLNSVAHEIRSAHSSPPPVRRQLEQPRASPNAQFLTGSQQCR